MKTVVIYKSTYGFTEKYAKWIAEALSCDLIERKNVNEKNLSGYDVIIYGGGLYAGGVAGIKLLTKNIDKIKDKKIVIFTCGLSAPSNKEYSEGLRTNIEKLFAPKKIRFFHLRGGLDYSKLKFPHKIMLSMLFNMLKNKPASEITDEQKEIVESHGKRVDYTDKSAISPIVEHIKNL